jgi:hypothetical protein
MELAERAKAKLLDNAYDVYALVATHIIVVVAVIAWMAGNRGPENGDALAP